MGAQSRYRDMDERELGRTITSLEVGIADCELVIEACRDAIETWKSRRENLTAFSRYTRQECNVAISRAENVINRQFADLSMLKALLSEATNQQYLKSSEFWHRKTRKAGY